MTLFYKNAVFIGRKKCARKLPVGIFSNRYFCRLNNLGERHSATRHNQRSGDRAWSGTTPVDYAHKIYIYPAVACWIYGVIRDARWPLLYCLNRIYYPWLSPQLMPYLSSEITPISCHAQALNQRR